MSALQVTAKVLALLACVTVLPFWLVITLGLPVLPSVVGSIVLAIFLSAVWTGGKRGA